MKEQKPKTLDQLLAEHAEATKGIGTLEDNIAKSLRAEVETALGKAVTIFPTLKKVTRELFWSGPPLNQTLQTLGLRFVPPDMVPTRRKGGNGVARSPRVDIPEDKIKAFLGTGKHKQGEIATHFGVPTQTIKNKLMKLKAAGKVDCKELGKGKGKGVEWWWVGK